MGGSSKEKEISFKSADTIYEYIDKSRYNPYKVLCINKYEFEVIDSNKIIIPHQRLFIYFKPKTNSI